MPYYKYHITANEVDYADFFALYRIDYDLFYIIPNTFKGLGKTKMVYVSVRFKPNGNNTNWSEYLNRYDLLINNPTHRPA